MKNTRSPQVLAVDLESSGLFRRAAYWYRKAEMGALGHTFAALMEMGRVRCLRKARAVEKTILERGCSRSVAISIITAEDKKS